MTIDLNVLPDCPECNNTRVVKRRDSVLPSLHGEDGRLCSCKRCADYKRRLHMFRKSRAPKRHWNIECDDLKGLQLLAANVSEFQRLTNMRPETVMDAMTDTTVVCRNATYRVILSTIFVRDLILNHAYSASFVTSEEIIIAALEQSKFQNTTTEVVDLEKLEAVDFLVVEGGHEFCLAGKGTAQSRAVINNLFKNRCFSGKRNIFMSAYGPKVLVRDKPSDRPGFIYEIITDSSFVYVEGKKENGNGRTEKHG